MNALRHGLSYVGCDLIESNGPNCRPNRDAARHGAPALQRMSFYVGNMKGVGRIYQQTFIDTYAKVAFA
jgi:hypothetical protein